MIVHVSANTDCTYLYCLLLQWGFGDTEPHNLKVMLSMAPEAEFLAAKNQIDHAKVSIDCIRFFVVWWSLRSRMESFPAPIQRHATIYGAIAHDTILSTTTIKRETYTNFFVSSCCRRKLGLKYTNWFFAYSPYIALNFESLFYRVARIFAIQRRDIFDFKRK